MISPTINFFETRMYIYMKYESVIRSDLGKIKCISIECKKL